VTLARRLHHQLVVEPLMRKFLVIVIFEFLAKNVHVLVAKYDKMDKAFLLNYLDESLHEGNRIR
jgi:hypothetical protein